MSDIMPMFLVVDKEADNKDIKPILLDKVYVSQFQLKEDEKFIYIDDLNENQIELLSEIKLVCGSCFSVFLNNIGYTPNSNIGEL